MSTSAFLIMPKPLTVCGSQQTVENYSRDGNTGPPYLLKMGILDHLTWKICMKVKKQQLEPDMQQQTGSKSGEEYIKAVYCHPAYLT